MAYPHMIGSLINFFYCELEVSIGGATSQLSLKGHDRAVVPMKGEILASFGLVISMVLFPGYKVLDT